MYVVSLVNLLTLQAFERTINLARSTVSRCVSRMDTVEKKLGSILDAQFIVPDEHDDEDGEEEYDDDIVEHIQPAPKPKRKTPAAPATKSVPKPQPKAKAPVPKKPEALPVVAMESEATEVPKPVPTKTGEQRKKEMVDFFNAALARAPVKPVTVNPQAKKAKITK
jgi:hypothetical protein